MATMSRTPSRESPLARELSIEETYSLASVARRKSSTGSKTYLRQRLGHAIMLEALENAIRNSPPPSPQTTYSQPKQHIQWATLDTQKRESRPEVDEYGFSYDDEDEDDGLSLCRTVSRSHWTTICSSSIVFNKLISTLAISFDNDTQLRSHEFCLLQSTARRHSAHRN